MEFPEEILINEMVLRDGLQLEDKVVSVEEKALTIFTFKRSWG